MIKLNNKGQSLVLFVLLLPILLLVMVLVIDVGNVIVKKQEIDNINYLTIDYGLEHFDDIDLESKLENMLVLNNVDFSNVEININDNKIEIFINKKVNGVFVKQFNIFSLKSRYVGYIKEDKKIIERVWYYE